MIGIVIVAHGGLAREYLAAVEHVVGKQATMLAISIEDDHNRAAKQAEMDAKVADLSARLDAALKKTATLSADFDGEDLERQVKRLSKTVKAMQQGGV